MRVRNQARGIVINIKGEMLFVKHVDPTPTDPNQPERLEYWVPPGGGLENCESYEEAALREVFEETGLKVQAPCVHMHTFEKPLMYGDELRLMHAQYYLISHNSEIIDVEVRPNGEGIQDVRWWSLRECVNSNEIFLPDGILAVFDRALKMAR